MKSNDINETNSSAEQKASSRPLGKLVRVNKTENSDRGYHGQHEAAPGEYHGLHEAAPGEYHGLHEAAPLEWNGQHEVPLKADVSENIDGGQYHGRYESENSKDPKGKRAWQDILVKVCAITVSLATIIILILTLPIVNFKEKNGSSKRVSMIYFFRNYKWLGHIEGELDKNKVDIQPDPNIKYEEIDDGLDLPQLIEGQYSVLFLGFDEKVVNTDVMWVLQFDILAGKLNILQIPRDTCLPDYTTALNGKFNSIYHNGKNPEGVPKIQNVVDAVQENFGIPIDAYITTVCYDIVDMVDLIGGIPMHLDNKIIYEAGKVIPAGDVVLNGEQAEWFIRFRHEWLQGDVGRIQNQRRFMAAAMRKLINIAGGEDGHNQLYKYLSTIYKNKWIATDMTVNDLTKLADFAGKLKMENVRVNMVPGEENDPAHRYNGNDVYSVHKQATIDMLNKYFRPYQRPMTEADTAIVEYITDYKHTLFDDTSSNFEELENSTEPVRDPAAAPEWDG